MDKIPFEEWALKSIDPPSLSTKIRPAEGLRDKSETGSTKEAEEEVHAVGRMVAAYYYFATD